MPGKPSFQFYPGDWLKDPALRRCDPATRGVWIDMLCAMHNAASHGRLHDEPRGLARLCGCFPDEVDRAIDDLANRGVAEITRLTDGTVEIVSRRMEREQRRRENASQRVRKHRQRVSEENPGQPPAEPRKARPEDVEAIYQAYPRKAGKGAALKAIRREVKRLATREDDPVEFLTERVVRFAASPKGRDPQFCPYPATWFNQHRYDDDPSEWAISGQPAATKPKTLAELRNGFDGEI